MVKTKPNELPEFIRPFAFHRVNVESKSQGDILTECPFCGETKFFLSQDKGLYDCKKCKVKGNVYTFIRTLVEQAVDSGADISLVAEERGTSVEALDAWKLCRSIIDGEWMLPGFSWHKTKPVNMTNLYRWSKMGDKRRLLTTPTLKHTLFGVHLWDNNKPTAHICEGPWDAIAWWDTLRKIKRLDNGEYHRTVDMKKSLLAEINVVAVPGCDTFKDEWAPMFAGKDVVFFYDSDHPKENKQTGAIIPPCGYNGLLSAAAKLSGIASSISMYYWGEGGFDSARPSGFDLRDLLKS